MTLRGYSESLNVLKRLKVITFFPFDFHHIIFNSYDQNNSLTSNNDLKRRNVGVVYSS